MGKTQRENGPEPNSTPQNLKNGLGKNVEKEVA